MNAKTQRSSPYPSYSLEYCLELVTKIYINFGAGSFYANREQIAKVLGISAAHLQTQVSSATQYGLLELKQGEGYKPSNLFRSIHKPLDEMSRLNAIKEAFKSPSLYAALITSFQNEIVPIASLPNILLHRHNISDTASDKAATIFIENARSLGFLTDNNTLSINGAVETYEQYEEVNDEAFGKDHRLAAPVQTIETGTLQKTEQKQLVDFPTPNGSIPFNIPLKGGRTAQIIVPSDVKSTDFDFIINFINLMKQQYD